MPNIGGIEAIQNPQRTQANYRSFRVYSRCV